MPEEMIADSFLPTDPHLSTVTEGQVQTPTSPTFRNFPRSRTIEFRDEDSELRLRRTRTHNPDPGTLAPLSTNADG